MFGGRLIHALLAGLLLLMNSIRMGPEIILDRELALKFYRWPTAWRIWTGPGGPAVLALTQSERNELPTE
jgi:hypothetical protein